MILFILFLIGICIGSFLGVVVDRLPRGESIVGGRSYCEFCKKKLNILDLIPLFSFIFLGGKCRYCHKRLSWYYPLIELLTGLSFLGIALLVSNNMELFFYLFTVSCLIVIFFTDLKYGIIPFSIVLIATLLIFFYYLQTANYLLLPNFLSGLGAFAFLGALFLLTRGKGMGFGDVVYAFLMGFILGFPQIIIGFYIAFLSGAVISLLLIALKKKKLKGSTVPFGPFLVAGTLIGLFFGQTLIDIAMRFMN